jgi:hypothetical protein
VGAKASLDDSDFLDVRTFRPHQRAVAPVRRPSRTSALRPDRREVAPRQCCHGLRRGTSHPPRSTAEVTVCQRLRAHPAPARSVTLSDPSRPGTHAIDFDAGFHISPRRSFCAALSTSPITLRRPFHDCEPVWLDRRGWRRIRHIAELVGERPIPVRRLPERYDWPGDVQADRERRARGVKYRF